MKKFTFAVILVLLTSSTFAQPVRNDLFESANHFYEIEDYERAIITSEKALIKTPVEQQAPIYYLLGRAQAALEFYDSALVSFELGIDLSSDSELDEQIDLEIEKTVRKQQMAEAHRLKNKFSLSLGIGHDTNVLNVNADNYAGINLKTVSAIYGFTFARKAAITEDTTLIPEFNFQDNYSLNSSLESNSTVQTNDALIWSITVPYIQYRKIVNNNDYVKYQLLYQNVYLPSSGSKRSLAYVSTGLSAEYLLNMSPWYVLIPSFGLFSDSSQVTVADSADNTTATRLNFKFLNLFNVTRAGNQRVSFRIDYINNNAGGSNAFYNRFISGVGYNVDWVYDLVLNLEYKYQITNYSKTTTSREDNLSGIDLEMTKQLSKTTRLGGVINYQTTKSTVSTYQYDDAAVSIFYNKAFEF